MAWGTVLGVGAMLGGTYLQSEAQAEAAKLGAKATRLATESERRMAELAMSYGAPYRAAGEEALGLYGDVPMGMTEEDLLRMEEGAQAIRAMQAAQGRRRAGGSAEQLGQYAGGFMEDVYNRAYADLLERAGIGARFAGGAAGAALGAGQDIASTYISGAQQQAPYITAQGQAMASGLAAAGRLGGEIMNYYGSQPVSPVSTAGQGTLVEAGGYDPILGE